MRLSVRIITYNHERFIEQAVESALNQQTDFPYEIVIGEDASTDATSEVLGRLAAAHPGRLRIEQRHRNVGAQVNFLETVAACRGEFVAILEGDDFWTSEHKLQRQVDFLDRNPEASFCFHRTRALNDANPAEEFVQPPSDPPALSSLDFVIQISNPIAFGSIVARREHLAGLPGWFVDLKLGDWPLCVMLATQGKIGYLAEELSRYRIHADGSWSRLSPYHRVPYTIQSLLRVRSLLTGEHRDLVGQRAGELADWWAGDLVPNPEVAIEPLVEELVRSGDAEFLTFLFSRTLAKARQTAHDCQWFAGEVRTLRALADDASAKTVRDS